MSQLSEALKSFDTGYLTKAKNELIHAIPGDATFTSHVGMILRALLAHELGLRAQAAAPQKLAEEPEQSTEPAAAPPDWADPAPGEFNPPNEPFPLPQAAPPPTPSTRAAAPRPTRPPPRDW